MTCPKCHGSRHVVEGGIEMDCPKCKATGRVNDPNDCTECGGSGDMVVESIEMDCSACNGTGTREAQLAIAAEKAGAS